MRDITSGKWVIIETNEEHRSFFCGARCTVGTFDGPGKYYLLQYHQPCPRGCCEDFVKELISPNDLVREIRYKMQELATLLRESTRFNKSNG